MTFPTFKTQLRVIRIWDLLLKENLQGRWLKMGDSKNLFPWINKYTPAKRSTPCEKNLRTSQTCSTTNNKKDYIKTGSSLGRKAMMNLDSILKSRDIILPTKGPYSQSHGFSSSHVWIWELDHKESWALNNWCFWTVVLEKTLESPLDFKEFQPVHPKGNQSWIFFGKTDAETETPVLWPPDAKKGPLEKTLMLRKIEGGRRRGQ